jgi:hypothetical protein
MAVQRMLSLYSQVERHGAPSVPHTLHFRVAYDSYRINWFILVMKAQSLFCEAEIEI